MAYKLTVAMRWEYMQRYRAMAIRPTWQARVDAVCDKIAARMETYEEVATTWNGRVPWWVVAIIHSLEGSLNFNTHLHNGDSLKARTVQIPKGRPPSSVGDPPFSWVVSAIDAIEWDKLDESPHFHSLSGTLYEFEGYNGFGNRRYKVPSPYLWSGSDQYDIGKFASDGKFDPQLRSKQVGAAVIMRRLAERNRITLKPDKDLLNEFGNILAGSKGADVQALQQYLNAAAMGPLGGAAIRVDGSAGPMTQQLFTKVFGFAMRTSG